MGKINFTEEQELQIVDLYNSGTSMEKIAPMFGVSTRPIKRILQEHNVKIRDCSHCNRHYELDETYFDEIDTFNKAYVLGLLYADGCNFTKQNKVKLSLQEQDGGILFSILEDMHSNMPLRFHQQSKVNPNWSDLLIMTLSNKHISERLLELGMVPCKSLVLTFPTFLSDEFMPHFIRGYVDGDGHIDIGKSKYVQIAGTSQFCKCLKDYIMEKLGIETYIYNTHNKESNIKVLVVRRKADVLKFLDWMYNDAELYIRRKHEAYLKLKEEMAKKTLSD